MPTAAQVLAIARSQIGYREGANNNNKYGQAYGWNNVAWCVQFQWWNFRQAGASSLFYGGGKTASCSQLYAYHNNKGQAISISSLRAGDIVFFDFSGRKASTDHVGIVESVDGNTVVTIEGNTSSGSGGSQANGDGVYRRNRSKTYISRAYRPAYDGVPSGTDYTLNLFIRDIQDAIGVGVDGEVGPITLSKVPTLSKKINQGHACVYYLQNYLNSIGYSCGTADGEFGNNTHNGVVAFQKAKGLEADGIVGLNTWKALFDVKPDVKPAPVTDGLKDTIKELQRIIGVSVDGIVGPKTLAALPTCSTVRNRKHAVVRVLQKRLATLNFSCGSIDGIFGSKTKEAVKAFQQRKGLSKDGVVGQNTWKALLS